MVHYDEFIFCSGPWCSLDNYLYSDQACKLFSPLYQIFIEHIKEEEDLRNIFSEAYALGRLVFLDNHPELHYSDYISSVTSFEEEDDALPNYYFSTAVLLSLYAIIKCRKRKSQVTDLFADQIYKAVYNNVAPANSYGSRCDKSEWANRASAIVEKIQSEGGIKIDLLATCIDDEDYLENICDAAAHYFDLTDYFWTKDDCIRYIRLGKDVDQQSRIYKSFAEKIYTLYQEAKRDGDEKLMLFMRSELDVTCDGRFYVTEFELPQFSLFNNYLTLGAVDYKDEDAHQDNIVPQENVETEIDNLDTKRNSINNNFYNLTEGSLKQSDKNRCYLAYLFLKKALGITELSLEYCDLIAFITGKDNSKSVQTTVNKILKNSTQGNLSSQEKGVFRKLKDKYGLG